MRYAGEHKYCHLEARGLDSVPNTVDNRAVGVSSSEDEESGIDEHENAFLGDIPEDEDNDDLYAGEYDSDESCVLDFSGAGSVILMDDTDSRGATSDIDSA